ncbi:MAG: hypothetical protein FJX89_00540 [Bacteroidetes bacterium]|nr:hypothetical protein [Bacteroidota bacterium]
MHPIQGTYLPTMRPLLLLASLASMALPLAGSAQGIPVSIRRQSPGVMAMAKPSEAEAAQPGVGYNTLVEVLQTDKSRPKLPGTAMQNFVIRKELMVQPHTPRFLREGDRLTLPVRITNCSDSEQTGQAQLELFDPENGASVDGYFHNVFPVQFFTAPAGQTVAVAFTMSVPADFHRPVGLRVRAATARHTDREERILPVLSNRLLVTESVPLRMDGLGSRTFRFEKLLQSGDAPTLTQHRLTLEYAASPAWYAVAALPLTGYAHASVEQSFNRFYANAVAAQAAAGSPRIREWVARWATDSAAGRQARASAIGQQPALRDILLEETPWVTEARDQAAQRRQLASLFETGRLASALKEALAQVRAAQNPDGGFAWFPDGPSDRYMSQYILANMGRMQTTGAVPAPLQAAFSYLLDAGLRYLSGQLQDDHREATRRAQPPASPSPLQVQALYALSCHPAYKPPAKEMAAQQYYRSRIIETWPALPLQVQAMAALALHRTGATSTAKAILHSLRERAVQDSTLGMYWKGGRQPWYWQEAPIETQSLLLEAFLDINQDTATADQLRLWLLTKKQTERWESTRATADACRALLAMGSHWLAEGRAADIFLGHQQPLQFQTLAGGGGLQASLEGPAIKPEMGHIRVRVTGDSSQHPSGLSWGAVHWQYFEHLDRLTATTGPLAVEKQLYQEKMTAAGPILEALTEASNLTVGDKLIVRLLLRNDRDMEYVHLKDMRGSGTEPADGLSGYQWKGALGYYLSPRDAATHFFLPIVPKGTHVFEYTLFVSHAGQFPAGIATAECLYAPSFRGHAESLSIRASERPE